MIIVCVCVCVCGPISQVGGGIFFLLFFVPRNFGELSSAVISLFSPTPTQTRAHTDNASSWWWRLPTCDQEDEAEHATATVAATKRGSF